MPRFNTLRTEIRTAEQSLKSIRDWDASFAVVVRLAELHRDMDGVLDAAWERAQQAPNAAQIRSTFERGDNWS